VSVAALLLSLAMLGAGGRLAVRLWGCGGADAFWVYVAAVAAQIGLAAQASSMVGRFTAGGVLACQGVLVLLLAGAARTPAKNRSVAAPERVRASGAVRIVCVVLAAVVVATSMSLTRQLNLPVRGWDECNYHGPRMAYWLQSSSVLPYPTHNERQTLFPCFAEMVSVWPLVFVRGEWLARGAFWVCLPLGAAGVWTVCRALGLSRPAAWGGAALWVTTPAVLQQAESLKSDIWQGVFLLGAAYWIVRPRPTGERPWARWVWAGVFIGMAVGVKTTAAAVLPGVLLVAALGAGGLRERARSFLAIGPGLLAGALVSGLAVVLGCAVLRYGHPLGPPELRVLVRADMEARSLLTNAARAALFLIEFPSIPEGARAAVQEWGRGAARALGADRVLRFEEGLKYPGRFEYRLAGTAAAFSLGGLLWGPALVLGGARAVRLHLLRRKGLSDAAALAVMAGGTLLGVVLMLRWMGGGPQRFWQGAYAMAVPLIAFFAARACAVAGRPARVLVGAGLVWALVPSFVGQVHSARDALRAAPDRVALDAPYAAVMQRIEPGARILLIAGNTTREWALFDPRGGFRNRVYSWALADYEPARASAMVGSLDITHVVIEGEGNLIPRWKGVVNAGPVLTALRARGDFREVDVGADGPRLWVREPSGVRE
jgi:hypothetical protein